MITTSFQTGEPERQGRGQRDQDDLAEARTEDDRDVRRTDVTVVEHKVERELDGAHDELVTDVIGESRKVC